ncbi:transcriptional regulator family: Fungal Specific TF [Penicillium taxi]|uniref:transcriptional regulator family: Fungal Specific TF n=1 Tax=Penicillium taxi TaxID=168475 RepID=UPI0025450981|nr:transcriptional regulator family: Fungal Specific TF [Penicillium taxi]KAJ5887543.1 transcriptional regulator family: Fungal Specific TF [Penicillium taxi]
MASPSSINTHDHNESGWQYSSRTAKRRKRASTTETSRPSPREIGFMRESQNNSSASFIGSSSGIHFIRHVQNAFAIRSADLQQTRSRDRTSVPGEDDRLHRVTGNHDTDELWSKEELNFSPEASYSFDDLVHWTRSYFEYWHPIFPCLHAPTILKVMETISCKGPNSVSKLDLVIVRSIISISLGDRRQITSPEAKLRPVPATLLFQTVRHIMQDIPSLLVEPTTLPLLQATFMVQLVLTSLLRLNAASRVGGVITRTAFHLGLHRCPGRFSCFRGDEVDIRRRLFWCIYSLERYLSQALGIPLSIHDDDIDVCYPGSERHITPSLNPLDDQRLRLLCYLAKFSRVRGLILELRNKSILHSHPGTVEASHVNGELSQWWNEVYDDVNPIEDTTHPQGSGSESVLKPYHRLLLIILRHEAIISMNRPLLAAEEPSPDYNNALQTCISSSRSLLSALVKYMSSSDVPLTWPSFTWVVWMACLILMYASCEGKLPIPTALKYARMGISVLKNLALHGSSWPDTCIEAIRSMESALMNVPTSHIEQPHESTSGSTALTNNSGLSPSVRTSSLFEQQGAGVSQVTSSRVHAFDTPVASPMQRSETRLHADMTTQCNGIELHVDDLYSHTPNSASLIFGNTANRSAPFYPGMQGQESSSFDPSSFLMNDLWSVADGPWMIDGNLL